MTQEQLITLPKIELHCHLDGSLSREFIEKRLGRKVLQEELSVSDDCTSLAEYLEKFTLPGQCIMDEKGLEEAGYDVLRSMSRENEPADTIFFIGRGRAKATDYRISGIAYDFMKPKDLIALGGMEVIMELENYQTTWETETKCTVVKLPRAKYEKWIYADTDIFRLESKITCESLLEESRRNRLYLFLQGADRLALLFVEWFEK